MYSDDEMIDRAKWVWGIFWRRIGMYIGEPTVHGIQDFWHGYDICQSQMDNGYSIYGDFERFLIDDVTGEFGASGLWGLLQEKYDNENQRVEWIMKMVREFDMKRFGAIQSEIDHDYKKY